MPSFFENAFASISSSLEQTAGQHATEQEPGSAPVAANGFGNFANIGAMVGEFRSGRAVEIGRFSEAGFAGRIVAVADGSEAAKALGFE